MKTYRDYTQIPANAAYLGCTYPNGTIDESTMDAIEGALAPVCLIETDGSRHYFETAIELN